MHKLRFFVSHRRCLEYGFPTACPFKPSIAFMGIHKNAATSFELVAAP